MFARFFAWFRKLFYTVAFSKTASLPSSANLTGGWEPYGNTRQIIDENVKVVSNPTKGVVVHIPTPEVRKLLAKLIVENTSRVGLSLPYVLAVICLESAFDPLCINRNLLGRNPNGTNEGTDWGLAQVSGSTLRSLPDFGSWETGIAHAYDPNWSVPYIINSYRSLVEWAQGIRDKADTTRAWATELAVVYAAGSAVDPRWQNAGWLAALAYNRGRRGALDEVGTGMVVPHPEHVQHLSNKFSDELGEAHVMPDDTSLRIDAWK